MDGFAVGVNHCVTRLVCVPNQSQGSTWRFIPLPNFLCLQRYRKRQTPELTRKKKPTKHGRFVATSTCLSCCWITKTAGALACACVRMCREGLHFRLTVRSWWVWNSNVVRVFFWRPVILWFQKYQPDRVAGRGVEDFRSGFWWIHLEKLQSWNSFWGSEYELTEQFLLRRGRRRRRR